MVDKYTKWPTDDAIMTRNNCFLTSFTLFHIIFQKHNPFTRYETLIPNGMLHSIYLLEFYTLLLSDESGLAKS